MKRLIALLFVVMILGATLVSSASANNGGSPNCSDNGRSGSSHGQRGGNWYC